MQLAAFEREHVYVDKNRNQVNSIEPEVALYVDLIIKVKKNFLVNLTFLCDNLKVKGHTVK